MKIFIGNLSFDAKEPDVRKAFEAFGTVSSVVIKMKDHKLKSRGFGFVEMPDNLQAQAAIAGLNGKDFMGRPLKVDPARVETEAEKKRPERVSAHPEGAEKAEGYQHRKPKEKKPWRGSKPWDKRSEGVAKPWQKRKPGVKSWGKPDGESKPWQKRDGGSKPWEKRKDGAKPWGKPSGEAKPWKKPGAGAKPWQKRDGESKPWAKTGEGAKPWQKRSEAGAKPWNKRKPGAKPWEKPRRSPGGEWTHKKTRPNIRSRPAK